jgi:transcriptional regulator with PAS, ATPase and Fis domain
MNVQSIKQRFGIIGNSPLLDLAIDRALRVAPTDLTVLITGESGSGKEVMPRIIHQNSARKHGEYIAVNCGAIPAGTVDSELFGHEKGSFTGAHEARKGYFEVANGGTIFLDEVGELPLETQARLLRVLETGEYLRVGSSKAQKTNVRVVAATNVEMLQAVQRGTFRADLYYRLNTIPIHVPSLRERTDDIHLLFRKFAVDAAERYRMPVVNLRPDAVQLLAHYTWPGNVRQLKNVAEQVSVLEQSREIDARTLRNYLPDGGAATTLPAVTPGQQTAGMDRELLLKLLFDLKGELDRMKAELGILRSGQPLVAPVPSAPHEEVILPLQSVPVGTVSIVPPRVGETGPGPHDIEHTELQDSLSLVDMEKDLIRRALEKHRNKRKRAAEELGISERTLYRKIKEYDIQ